jgi:hypothetical protein
MQAEACARAPAELRMIIRSLTLLLFAITRTTTGHPSPHLHCFAAQVMKTGKSDHYPVIATEQIDEHFNSAVRVTA